MGLNFSLNDIREVRVFDQHITHNLTEMASAAGLYEILWRPEEIGVETAEQAIPFLERGIAELKSNRDKYEKYNPSNGWGSYDGFCKAAQSILDACYENKYAKIHSCR